MKVISVILVVILVSSSSPAPFSWVDVLLNNAKKESARDEDTLEIPQISQLLAPGNLRPRYGFWDPFNLFGAPPTTSTTPFPYPEVAAFFSNPGDVVNGMVHGSGITNITQNPDVVKCLANIIETYTLVMAKSATVLPNCIQGQVMGAIWLVPQVLGILPSLKLLSVPSDTMNNCKYEGGCILKAVQDTIKAANDYIGGLVQSLRDALPTVTNLGKGAIYCMSNEFANMAKDLPKTTNMTCLTQPI